MQSHIDGLLAGVLLISVAARAQIADLPDDNKANIPVNYTESKVGTFTLPDPLKLDNGQAVADAATWTNQRRPEILKQFETQVYGRIPSTTPMVTWEVTKTDPKGLGGTAIIKEFAGHMGSAGGPVIGATLYLPTSATGPVPVLVSINFNFAALGRRGPASGATSRPVPTSVPARRNTPADMVGIGMGYVALTYNSIETDAQGQSNLNLARKLALAPGQTAPAEDEWGAIASWAWGISRVVDYLQTDSAVDAKRIAITGVSRLGKTVMWAGANDTRIALVIASCSGEGGAALARRNYGETIAHLTAPTRYPYQFAGNYQKYAKDPNTMPVDTHELVALIAPRPLLLQTGNTDNWSDPKGEFEAAVAATPVYKLLGQTGIETAEMPAASQLVGGTLSYFMHAGGHGTIPSDWDIYIAFMKKHLHPGT